MTDLANSTPGFQDLKLTQICLPATHDTGTYSLESTFTKDDGAWIKAVTDTIQAVRAEIDRIPGISAVIDPLDWVESGVLDDTRALATATHADIGQQLNDGIRCLDLRVYYNPDDPVSPFYTYHGLAGVRIETILDEVAYFISVVAPAGEIVYVTLSQYWDDNTPDNGFTQDQLNQLTALIWKCFPDESQVFGPFDAGIPPIRPIPPITPDLLSCTYSQIVKSGGSNRSKVVLVMQPPVTDPLKIWPQLGEGSPQFSGSYADSDDWSKMIADQQSKSIQAKSDGLPFVLMLIVTPQSVVAQQLIEGDLAKPIGILAGEVFAFFFFINIVLGGTICAVLLALAYTLAFGNLAAAYSSLQELSSEIFSSAPTVSAVYQDYFFGLQYAVPSIIWMDFYEDHRMDTPAGHNVAQVVELSKALTRANAVREALSAIEMP
jgi:hypothetical protein